MKKSYIYLSSTVAIALLLTATQLSLAQTLKPDVLLTAGGAGSGSTCTLSWSIGEAVIEKCESAGNYLTQGFQQPELPVVTNVESPLPMPTEFILKQNYPNPFNPSTEIRFSIPFTTQLKLRVYDNYGRLVKTLVDSYMNAGSYTVQFDAGDLPSGTYRYQIDADVHSLSKNMILMK
jgi:type IX secretion system substrate protein